MNTQAPKGSKVSKLRMAAGVTLTAVGMSVFGAVAAPAVANAYPSGPLHPIRHYRADIFHPIWAFRHPIRALIP